MKIRSESFELGSSSQASARRPANRPKAEPVPSVADEVEIGSGLAEYGYDPDAAAPALDLSDVQIMFGLILAHGTVGEKQNALRTIAGTRTTAIQCSDLHLQILKALGDRRTRNLAEQALSKMSPVYDPVFLRALVDLRTHADDETTRRAAYAHLAEFRKDPSLAQTGDGWGKDWIPDISNRLGEDCRFLPDGKVHAVAPRHPDLAALHNAICDRFRAGYPDAPDDGIYAHAKVLSQEIAGRRVGQWMPVFATAGGLPPSLDPNKVEPMRDQIRALLLEQLRAAPLTLSVSAYDRPRIRKLEDLAEYDFTPRDLGVMMLAMREALERHPNPSIAGTLAASDLSELGVHTAKKRMTEDGVVLGYELIISRPVKARPEDGFQKEYMAIALDDAARLLENSGWVYNRLPEL